MEPSLHVDSLLSYFWEKWGVTDEKEGLQYLKQWNETVKKGAAEVEFETVFGVAYGKMGVVTDPADSNTCLLFGYYPVWIARHDVGAGRGGYA